MGSEYYYNSIDPGMEALGGAALGVASFIMVFFLVFYLLMLAFGIVCYVLQALGMYTIAKRRGIRHPWLSWLPIGELWILGSISDQYQYVAKGKVRSRRKVLIGLMIAVYCIMALEMALLMVGAAGAAGLSAGEIGGGAVVGTTLAIVAMLYFAMIVMAIVSAVFQYIALYDLYASCNPDNAVLFLVLSIFLSITPFFIFFNRNKDLGMPPRKELEQAKPEFEPVAE